MSTGARCRRCSRRAIWISKRSTRRAKLRPRRRSPGCVTRCRTRCSCSFVSAGLPRRMRQPAEGPHPDLDAAMHRHWTEQIETGNRHTRQVLVALVAPTPAALDAACAHATDRLAALGVSAVRVVGDALVAAVTDGFDTNLYWYEHPKYAVMGDVMARGHALRRLPGHAVEAGWLAPLLSVQTRMRHRGAPRPRVTRRSARTAEPPSSRFLRAPHARGRTRRAR